jgi:hypothetical protein
MRRFLIGVAAALAFTGAMAGEVEAAELGGDLLSGNAANLVQLSLASLTNSIAGSPIIVDASSINGVTSAGITTGSITGLSQETTGGINVMMVNTGMLSNQQSVVSTSTAIEGLPAIESLVAGASGAN